MYLYQVLEKIQRDAIEIIQEEVQSQFDNLQQSPLGFGWRKSHHEVLKLLTQSKSPTGDLEYLVLTDKGIFCLVLMREGKNHSICRSKWVLRFRVLSDDEESAAKASSVFSKPLEPLPQGAGKPRLIPLLLANVAHYHGHLCPDLAVGYRAAMIGCEQMSLSRKKAHEFFVIAENTTSAIDALQLVTGCTIGNRNFFVKDLGKHVYSFGSLTPGGTETEVLRLGLISLAADIGHDAELEARILSGRASQADCEEYQEAIDDAVRRVLSLPESQLFSTLRQRVPCPEIPMPSAYARCSWCGEVTQIRQQQGRSQEYPVLCLDCAKKAR